jgi:hypothetical protein
MEKLRSRATVCRTLPYSFEPPTTTSIPQHDNSSSKMQVSQDGDLPHVYFELRPQSWQHYNPVAQTGTTKPTFTSFYPILPVSSGRIKRCVRRYCIMCYFILPYLTLRKFCKLIGLLYGSVCLIHSSEFYWDSFLACLLPNNLIG